MARVMVTGASGFTGSRLTARLVSCGHDVVAMVRQDSQLSLLDNGLIHSGKLTLAFADVRNQNQVERAMADVEYVYHIAALYRSAKHPERTYWDVNVGGTENVLQAAASSGVKRVLHCSTVGVHGDVREIPSNEDGAFAPDDVYQVTKLEGERVAQKAIVNGQPITIVRPAGIYGPGDRRFLKLFSLVRSGRFVMFGSGQTLLHLIYIDDLVQGMQLAMENDECVGKTLILAGSEYVSLNELVELVAHVTNSNRPRIRLPLTPLFILSTLCEFSCKLCGLEPPLHRRRAAFFVKNRAFSTERARREIGFDPQVDLHEGLRRTARWYQQQKLLPI